MPAYFSIVFELHKTPTAVRDFCTALVEAGLTFQSGYWGFEQDKFEDILTRNQSKLDQNFQLGRTEHYSHDYRQMLFRFADFSEVRLFLMNDTESETFTYHLIIPEEDLAELVPHENGHTAHRQAHRMELLKALAKTVWNTTHVLAIQTGWEESGFPPKAQTISGTNPPQAEPFCIISAASAPDTIDVSLEEIGRGGVILEKPDAWNYS